METDRSRLLKKGLNFAQAAPGWRGSAGIAFGGEPLPGARTEPLATEAPSPSERIAYGALLLFVTLIYITPGTLYPPIENLPIAKAVAVISFLFLFSAMRAKGASWRLSDPPSLWLVTFAVFGGLSIATALWREYAFNFFLDFLKVVLVYFLVVHLLDRLDRIEKFFWVALGGAMVLAVGTLAHFVFKINPIEGYRAAWIGIYEDPNDLAYQLVVLIPIGLALLEAERSLAKKLLVSGILAVFIAAIYVTYSRGALVGLLAIAFFQILRSRNRIRHFSLAAILMMVLLAVAPAHYWERAETILKYRQDESAMGRIYAWKAGLAMVEDRPLLGVGIGCFVMGWPIYAPPEAGTKWRAPHNTFVAVMGETGLLGFLAFGAFIGTALRRAQKVNRPPRPAPPPRIRPLSSVGRAAPVSAPAMTEADRKGALYARGVEVALWGFLACSLTLGVQRSWPPYLFAGLAVALYTIRTVEKKTVKGESK